jgi:hypothetical protein
MDGDTPATAEAEPQGSARSCQTRGAAWASCSTHLTDLSHHEGASPSHSSKSSAPQAEKTIFSSDVSCEPCVTIASRTGAQRQWKSA